MYTYYKREFFPNARTIIFSTVSEPLMYKNWDKVVEDCNKFKFQPVITTNFLLANKERIKRLLEADFVIKISLDAIDEKIYKKIRGGEVNRVLTNIDNLIHYRDEMKKNKDKYSDTFKKRSKILFHVTPNIYNMDELIKIAKKAIECNIDQVYLQEYIELECNRHLSYKKNLTRFIHKAEEMMEYLSENNILCTTPIRELQEISNKYTNIYFNRNKYYRKSFKKKKRAKKIGYKNCFWPFFATLVNEDNEIVPCCFMHISLNTLKKNTLKKPYHEIWNGEAYRRLRKDIINNTPDEYCKQCQYAINFEIINENMNFVD